MTIETIVEKQRAYYHQGNTKSYAYRMKALDKLETWINNHQEEIYDALYQDLHKAKMESYFCEVGMVLSELQYIKKHLKKWMKKQRVTTPLSQFYARSYILHDPYGCVLIMAPWNYPFMLSIEPLLAAIAAGNCAIVKPSAYAPATSHFIKDMIESCFDESYIAVVEGGREANTRLLDQKFDFIFFTGSTTVGKLVMEKASRYTTPVLLELGGKSPCIVDETSDIELAARRIVFGKFLNGGQTCVAPDYVLVNHRVHDALKLALAKEIEYRYGLHPLQNEDLPRIINAHHFKRLTSLLASQREVIGGAYQEDTLQIEPTIVANCPLDSSLMKEEIFGPILPLVVYDTLPDAIAYIQKHEAPLALYMFSNNRTSIDLVMNQCLFGGGCINDTIVHLASSKLPFGGVGNSGMGHYHGKYSFEAFSHQKSIVDKATWIDIPLRYHPYTDKKMRWIQRFLK